jgi:hypothetical protein
VHVVIIGFGAFDRPGKIAYDYPEIDADPLPVAAANISPYLVPGPDVAIMNRATPLCQSPEIRFGNQPIDGGHLLLDEAERDAFLRESPEAAPLLRPFLGAEEFINGAKRWCLWLKDTPPNVIRSFPEIVRRIEAVKNFRLASVREATRALAKSPSEFAFVSHPASDYLLIPSVSSEKRIYIPIGFMTTETVASNLALVVPSATHYHFGILTSEMHMAWVRQVCGRLESRYRYSNKLVYNNFPWPQDATDKQQAAVAAAAEHVLATRDTFKGQTLADLYDPLAMPKALRDAHKGLDRAVDKCYRAQPFTSERQRVEYLFDLYQRLITPLTAATPKRPARRRPPR